MRIQRVREEDAAQAAALADASRRSVAQLTGECDASASEAGAPGADADYGNGILNLDWAMNRNNPTHYDPAIASHSFDSASNRLSFVVQNRSAAALSGLSLSLITTGTGGAPTLFPLPPLAAGESYVTSVTVDPASLKAAGTLTYTTQLNLPPGLTDAVPNNNRRSSTLTAPK
jgi:hypothetical protein